MKVLFTVALGVLIASSTFAQTKPSCADLEFTGLKPNQGQLMVAVYASEAEFFKKPKFVNASKVVGDTAKVEVCGLDAAEIAVTAFQDLNGNDKMDSNPFGIPSEPYGASGKPSRFGPPTWASTKVVWPPVAGASVAVKF